MSPYLKHVATLHTHTHTRLLQLLQPFNSLFSRTTWVSRYQIGKTNLDFTGARDSKWQWHQLCHVQVCTSLQTDNHASTPPLCFLQAGCPSCYQTNSVKALKAECSYTTFWNICIQKLACSWSLWSKLPGKTQQFKTCQKYSCSVI